MDRAHCISKLELEGRQKVQSTEIKIQVLEREAFAITI